ncbi:MAG: TolB family protein, partial [Methyloligellaceae bacterium]
MSQLIPREKLFGNPERVGLQISPDGETLAWIAPKDDVLNVWMAPLESPDKATPVTDDRHRGIRFYTWSKAGDAILYFQDRDGDENWQMFRVTVADRQEANLTPYKEITTRLHGLSWDFPNTAVVGLNDRDKSWHDVYAIDLQTGERSLLFENDGGFGNFHVDRQLNLRLAERSLEEGGRQIFRFTSESPELEESEYIRVPHEDDLTTGIAGFTGDGDDFYWLSSLTGDKAGLFLRNFDSGGDTVIGRHDKANVSQLLVHPTTFRVEAYGANHIQLEWAVVDESVAADFDFLQSELSGELQIVSRSAQDDLWIVNRGVAEAPNTNYLYRKHEKKIV